MAISSRDFIPAERMTGGAGEPAVASEPGEGPFGAPPNIGDDAGDGLRKSATT